MTIRARLAVIYGGAMVLTLGLVGALVWWQLGAALRTALDQTLEARANGVLTALENQGQVGLQEGDRSGPAGVDLAMYDQAGRLIDATAGVPADLVPPAAGLTMADLRVGAATYLMHVTEGEGGIRVVAIGSLVAIDATLDRLARSLLIVGGAAALGSLVGGWWLAGRALRPVAAITREASRIGATDLTRRLPVPPRDDELGSLARTLNDMLDRVAEAVRRQRTFVASASHDLRTPIAALQTELELAGDDRTTPDELRTAVRSAHADAVRLGMLATTLLDLAAIDADGRALVRTAVRADALVATVVRRVEPLAMDRGTEVRQAAEARLVRVDRVRLEQALTNLIVNAIAHGPRGSVVDVTARIEASDTADGSGQQLCLQVLDRGPGIPADLASRLFEPFSRGPQSTLPGAGLGLASAAAAVRAHDGSIGYLPREGGGSCFWLRVPA